MSYTTMNKMRQLEVRRGIANAKEYGITDPIKAREIKERYWSDYHKTGDVKWLHLAHWAESVYLGAKELARSNGIAEGHTVTRSYCQCEHCTA